MTEVEALQGRLIRLIGDYKRCLAQDTLDVFVRNAISSLIVAVREEEHKEPTDEQSARLDTTRYGIWAAYFKTLYELMGTGMKRADVTAVMGELPTVYGDSLPLVEAEEGKFYLNTNHITVISTKNPKESPCSG